MRVLFFLFFSCTIFAQDTLNYRYFIYFEDKGSYQTSDFLPTDLLSNQSILRREKQNITLDYNDLPVFQNYIDTLENRGFNIIFKSKWFNGVLCWSNQNDVSSIMNLDFVTSLDSFGVFTNDLTLRKNQKHEEISDTYGTSFNQIEMLQGHVLHQEGFKGHNINIAVLDAGFRNANELDGLQHLFSNNKVKLTWDFVDNEYSVYDDNYHGMSVLSTMATNIENEFIGTAPNANYWLFRTEDSQSENLIEEYYWLIAAETCDSLGIDIINSSLSYTRFDLDYQNHSYSDLDGKTTPITRAATMAARKGMIVCSSAGNYGNNSWKYIGAPADADSILTVGSVDQNRIISNFSSLGPTSDGRLKPTISAQGGNTTVLNANNSINTSNGTSFSSPLIAGMTACLWQANYNKSAQEIINAIISSSHLVNNPNNSYGNGIPNFFLANELLQFSQVDTLSLKIYPNPIIDKSFYFITGSNEASFQIHDINGKLIYNELLSGKSKINFKKISALTYGTYIFSLISETQKISQKVVVIN